MRRLALNVCRPPCRGTRRSPSLCGLCLSEVAVGPEGGPVSPSISGDWLPIRSTEFRTRGARSRWRHRKNHL